MRRRRDVRIFRESTNKSYVGSLPLTNQPSREPSMEDLPLFLCSSPGGKTRPDTGVSSVSTEDLSLVFLAPIPSSQSLEELRRTPVPLPLVALSRLVSAGLRAVFSCERPEWGCKRIRFSQLPPERRTLSYVESFSSTEKELFSSNGVLRSRITSLTCYVDRIRS